MNPYMPPAETSATPYASGAGAGVTDLSVEMLRQTRPWVQLLGVLALIGAAFMLLGGVSMFALSALAPGQSAAMAGLGLVYVPFAVLYVYPGIKLWKYGSSISKLLATRDAGDLEIALGHQKSFWKFSGIVAITMVILYVLFFVGMMVVGITSGARH